MSDNQSTADFVREWFDQVWNQHEEAVINRLVRPEFTIVSRRMEEILSKIRGAEEFKCFLGSLLDAFPDFKLTVHAIVAKDDHVAVDFVLGGTLSGVSDRIPLCRRQIQTKGIADGCVRNGEFVDGWVELDMVPLNTQIGEFLRTRVEQRFEASLRGQ